MGLLQPNGGYDGYVGKTLVGGSDGDEVQLLNWNRKNKIVKPFALIIICFLPISMLVNEIQVINSFDNRDTGYFIQQIWITTPSDRPPYPENSYALVDKLNNFCKGDELLAMTEGGFFAYYTNCYVFDLHGWSDQNLTSIRYNKGQWNTPEFINEILSKTPDYILMSGYMDLLGNIQYRLPIENGMANTIAFINNYKMVGNYPRINEIYRFPYHPNDLNQDFLLTYFLFERIK